MVALGYCILHMISSLAFKRAVKKHPPFMDCAVASDIQVYLFCQQNANLTYLQVYFAISGMYILHF